MADVNAWIILNPMAIHIPIALWMAAFIAWWLVLVIRFGWTVAAIKIGRRPILFFSTLTLVAAWGLYSSALFEDSPIYWL